MAEYEPLTSVDDLASHLGLPEVPLPDDAPEQTCPLCGSRAHVCHAEHTDGPGARLHCSAASTHNFPYPATDERR